MPTSASALGPAVHSKPPPSLPPTMWRSGLERPYGNVIEDPAEVAVNRPLIVRQVTVLLATACASTRPAHREAIGIYFNAQRSNERSFAIAQTARESRGEDMPLIVGPLIASGATRHGGDPRFPSRYSATA